MKLYDGKSVESHICDYILIGSCFTDGRLEGFMSKSRFNDRHASKIVKEDEKDKEQRRETDGAKEKDRCKEKYWGKSIQELDLSNCQSCTPSYRLLPEDVRNHSICFPDRILCGGFFIHSEPYIDLNLLNLFLAVSDTYSEPKIRARCSSVE